MKIGIDIGGVIVVGGGEDDTFFTDQFVNTPAVEGALEALMALSDADHEVHLISKAGTTVEYKSAVWLEWHGVIKYLGISPYRVHFVRKRHLKAPMAQALELDIFIDDRQDIIDSMQGIVERPILFTSWEETLKALEVT